VNDARLEAPPTQHFYYDSFLTVQKSTVDIHIPTS
jgi:hypothetical protein